MNTTSIKVPLLTLKDWVLIAVVGLAIIFTIARPEAPSLPGVSNDKPPTLAKCLNSNGEIPKGQPACLYTPKADEKGFAFIVTANDNRAYYAEDPDVMGDTYDPKDKYLSNNEPYAKKDSTDSYSKESTGTKSVPQGDGPTPLYNSKETEWFNTYNDQYKNWHHE